MRKITTFAIGAVALSSLAYAEVEVGAYGGYHSKYVFRGFDLGGSDPMVDFGLDIGGSCDCGLDWYLGTWYAATESAATDEFDVFAGVTKDLGFGSVDLGYVNYSYMDTGIPSDGEIYLGLSTGYQGFDLGLTTSFGVQGIWKNVTTIEGSVGYGYDVSDQLSLGVSVVGGYFAGQAGMDGIAYGSATLSGDYALSDSITLSPYVTYVETAEEYNVFGNTGNGDGFHGGISLSFGF